MAAMPESPRDAAACRVRRQVSVRTAGTVREVTDEVAQEVPVAFLYNGTSHAVMLATPADLEDFARGFSVTEGIVPMARPPRRIAVRALLTGIEVAVDIAEVDAAALAEQSRALPGRSGCGVCGTRDLERAMRWPRPVTAHAPLAPGALDEALRTLPEWQQLNDGTGTVHAAAFADRSGVIHALREDIGRHNALDKLIGALLAAGRDPADGFVVVTSRASYEMVQKAASVGIPCLVAMSGPTELAVRMAESANLTLVGFAARERHVVYTHGWRLDGAAPRSVSPR
ncbi:MAG: formate dehydrogenase accessory sulfurtransferase FdhD [Gammaproteobacteria bacterium]